MQSPEKMLFFSHPEFTTEQDYTILWAILSRGNSLPWLYNSFIQIRGYKYYYSGFLSFDEADLAFDNCPFFDYQIFNRDNLRTIGSSNLICEILANFIENDYYVYLMLDQFYNPNNKNCYQQIHFAHNTLLYGFTRKDACFFLADFYDCFYETGKSISFDSLLSAFDLEQCNNQDWINYRQTRQKLELGNKIKIFKYIDSPYSFNISHFRQRLSDYLNSKNTKQRPDEQEEGEARGFIYGLDNYQYLTAAMDYIREKLKYNWNTVKALHLFHSHKKICCACIDYLFSNGLLNNHEFIREKYREIAHTASLLVPYFLKYNLSRNPALLSKIQQNLEKLYLLEKNILPFFIDNLIEKESCSYYKQFRELEVKRFLIEVKNR